MSTATKQASQGSDDSECCKQQVYAVLKDVALAITSMLGESCEAVIHDLSDLEHSIIWIQGDVTGRTVGGSVTDLGLEALRKSKTDPLLNYTTYTESGKTLTSSTIWLRDLQGESYGAFCINLDVTPVLVALDFLRRMAPRAQQAEVGERFFRSPHDMLDAMIAEFETKARTAGKDMNREQRIDMVRFLEERGAFQMRNAAPIVATRLGVTRETIYNYLGEVADASEGDEISD
jgi:predicted transcriptional regulator YheO